MNPLHTIESFKERYNELVQEAVDLATKDIKHICNKYNIYYTSGMGGFEINFKLKGQGAFYIFEYDDSVELFERRINDLKHDLKIVKDQVDIDYMLYEISYNEFVLTFFDDLKKVVDHYDKIADVLNIERFLGNYVSDIFPDSN